MNNPLDEPLLKPPMFASTSLFTLLVGFIVRHCKSDDEKIRVIGKRIGRQITDIIFLRSSKMEKISIKLTDVLVFIQKRVWRSIYGYELTALEKDNNENKYYFIEAHSASLWCIPGQSVWNFNAGIIEGILEVMMFRCVVKCHFHRGVTYEVIPENN